MKISGAAGTNNSIYCSITTSMAASWGTNTQGVTVTAGTYYGVIAVNGVISIDGSDTTNSNVFSNVAGKPAAAGNSQAGGVVDTTIHFGEGGVVDNVTWSSGTRTALCHNMRLYWGTGGTC